MTTFKKIELGSPGAEYVSTQLSRGHALAQNALRSHNIINGTVSTILPSSVDEKAALEFETGGKLAPVVGVSVLEPIANTDNYLEEEIKSFLETDERHVCIFEDASAEPTYPYLQNVDTRILTFNDEVYHLACPSDGSEQILKTIRLARSWLFIGIMTSARDWKDLCSSKKTLTTDDLRFLATDAERIVIGAYDFEGYVVWQK